MGKFLRSFICILLLFSFYSFGQVQNFNLEVSPGIAQLNITSLIVNKNLENMPRIFQVQIFPAGVDVTLDGIVYWTPNNSNQRNMIYKFKTKKFKSKTFDNTELDHSDIKIESDDEGNKSVIEDLRKFGTLTGKVEINLILKDLTNNRIFNKSETLNFDNPTQTLRVVSPMPGSVEDEGSVIARWEPIIGAKGYKITLIQKKNKDQSDQDALTSGKPLIQDKDVGNRTQVNLRSLLDRQWVPGMELVFQVKAVADAAAGEIDLNSQPTSFFIESPNDVTRDIVDPVKLFDLVLQGDLKIDQIKRVVIDGRRVDPQELMQLMRKLKDNPDLILNKRFLGKSGR